MKIAIIAAMQKELNLMLSLIPSYKETVINDMTVYEGKIGDHSVVLSQCGIGKVNAALRTSALISNYQPDLVINSGVAGGVSDSIHIGAVLVADRVAYHDVWCGPGTEYGQADGCPLFFLPYEEGMKLLGDMARSSQADMRFGLLCSGDKFISTPEEVAAIKADFPDALGCDMESAAIAQTCLKEEVPFLIIRVMSDMPGGGENITEYKNFWNDAPARTFETVANLIASLS